MGLSPVSCSVQQADPPAQSHNLGWRSGPKLLARPRQSPAALGSRHYLHPRPDNQVTTGQPAAALDLFPSYTFIVFAETRFRNETERNGGDWVRICCVNTFHCFWPGSPSRIGLQDFFVAVCPARRSRSPVNWSVSPTRAGKSQYHVVTQFWWQRWGCLAEGSIDYIICSTIGVVYSTLALAGPTDQ